MSIHAEWQHFLQNQNTQLASTEPLTTLAQQTTFCELSSLGLLRVTGADAESFLQGQLSNDIQAVQENHSQLSAYCSQKGRMLAVLRIIRRENSYYLQLPQERIASVAKRLSMFVMRAKVEIAPEENLISLGIAGEQAEKALLTTLPALPEKVDSVLHFNDLSLIQLPGPSPRFWVLGTLSPIQALWQSLQATAIPSRQEIWKLHDIRAGLPVIYNATADTFVPQMANMDLVQGLDFKKGCYVGQEIVARTHYLGKLKRRMYRATLESETIAKEGDDLFGDQDTQSAGKIVAIQEISQGKYELLAVVKIASIAKGEIHHHDNQGPCLQFSALPYSTELQA